MNLRYGEGLYFSSVSGKANDYATQSEKVPIFGWRCAVVLLLVFADRIGDCRAGVGAVFDTVLVVSAAMVVVVVVGGIFGGIFGGGFWLFWFCSRCCGWSPARQEAKQGSTFCCATSVCGLYLRKGFRLPLS